jgi:hypothetical protein
MYFFKNDMYFNEPLLKFDMEANMKKKHLSFRVIILMVLIITLLVGCQHQSATGNADSISSSSVFEESSMPVNGEEPIASSEDLTDTTPSIITFRKTEVQSQPIQYIPIEQVGSYNTSIITEELLNNCTLTDVDKSNLPYWTGYILENKISVNYGRDGWDEYTGGNWYYNEEEIKYLSENGFNCVRAVYSFSFLSNPQDVYSINMSELEQLDELISWCIKYNIHLIISQAGLPGKWASFGVDWQENTDACFSDELVGGNPELFTSSEMQDIYTVYFDMLAKRYKDIPNGMLSFELATENNVPDGNIDLQAKVLTPVAQTIWQYTPDRIVIVDDVFGQVPKKLAEIGCCISLHNHVYTVSDQNVPSDSAYETHWPMQYIANYVDKNSDSLILSSKNGFTAGKLYIYYEWYNRLPQILADGNVIYQPEQGDPVYETGTFTIDFPAGTKQLEVKNTDEMYFLAIDLIQEGRDTLSLAGSRLSTNLTGNMPSLMINDDLTIEDISENPIILDDVYFTKVILQPFIDTAKENDVSFLMTEVGTDTQSLSPDEYIDYEETWLKALKDNHISWMYNCVHNFFAPKEWMWHNGSPDGIPFTNFSQWKDTCYWINDDIANMLIKYQ